MKGIFLRALEEKERIIMMYLDRNNQLTERVVRVIKMNGDAVLVFCYYRKQLRTFNINNILSAGPIKRRVGA
jgi:predicted DNA-binding transcriptional regulator YafY